MGIGDIRVERDGWFIDIEPHEVSERPHWELRLTITRTKERLEERRGHRFTVAPELSARYKLSELKDNERETLLVRAAKNVILREMDEIFAEPEGGLDSVRPLRETDFG